MEAQCVSVLARDQGLFGDRQLSLGLFQLNYTYLKSGYFSINFPSKTGYLKQDMYPVSKMPWVLDQYAIESDKYNSDFYMSMASFVTHKRRAALLLEISILWIDFDFYKIQEFSILTPEKFNALIENVIEDMGLPLPSFSVASGRGIYVNWILDKPLPRSALARWKATMLHLNKKFVDYGADPKACLPTQIMRVSGSLNMRVPQWYPSQERTVRVLACRTNSIGSEKMHNFEYLAEHILPYTRDEVAAYKASKQLQSKKFQKYAENAKARSEYLAGIRTGFMSEIRTELRSIIANDEASNLWYRRLMAMRNIAKSLGGIDDGQGRNNWCWIMCNAMAYISNNSDLKLDMEIIIKEVIPSYTREEI